MSDIIFSISFYPLLTYITKTEKSFKRKTLIEYFARDIGIVGCGLKLLDKNKANYKKCLELNSKVKNDYSSKDLETFKSYILYANATLDKDIIDKLKKDLVNVVETAEIKPFELINNDLLVTDELMPKIKENIKDLKKSRLESGAWLYEDIDDIETIKKSGTLTINNMLILKNFKAI